MEQEIAQLVNLTEMEHMFLQRRGKHFNKIILMFYGGVGRRVIFITCSLHLRTTCCPALGHCLSRFH